VKPITLALAGDTMLGRGVAQRLATGTEPTALFDPELAEMTRAADCFVLNLECCVSDRGDPWPDPRKPFFFRAPPIAVEALRHLGVDGVTLANNHALDFGPDALVDTRTHLEAAGIANVGAGRDVTEARAPAILEVDGLTLGVIGVTDHPADFAADDERPGVAFANLRHGVPDWLTDMIRATRSTVDALLVTPHWGPNMTRAPVTHVRRALPALLDAGATLVAGHSAHVVHGAVPGGIFDLGDFVDDYAVDPVLRNDLGLLFLVELDARGVAGLEAVPLTLDYAHTRLARGAEAAWIARRFVEACHELGTHADWDGSRLSVHWRGRHEAASEPPR
jgi:hypothetical protein